MPEVAIEKIGLALSGGGSRAIAFHLGCLRALHDREILERVHILSGVSGGSVIAAMYAYSDDSFPSFERRVEEMLSRGMVWGIARETFLSSEALKIIAANLTSGLAALLGRIVGTVLMPLGWLGLGGPRLERLQQALVAPLPRFASRTTAFERHLRRKFFGQRRLAAVGRAELNVVINAAELRTQSAFRFGSRESGCWRFGRLTKDPFVATAVAASAAFPAFLPALDRKLQFRMNGMTAVNRVLITDGGAYDNLGISCMLPGRSSQYGTNSYAVDYIIACDASQGLPAGSDRPYFWGARMLSTILTIHRRTQSMSQDLLHRLTVSGEIRGFLLPYLGMIDAHLPLRPSDLVPREAVMDYPTDFNPMTRAHMELLSKRGEQLTNAIIDAYATSL